MLTTELHLENLYHFTVEKKQWEREDNVVHMRENNFLCNEFTVRIACFFSFVILCVSVICVNHSVTL